MQYFVNNPVEESLQISQVLNKVFQATSSRPGQAKYWFTIRNNQLPVLNGDSVFGADIISNDSMKIILRKGLDAELISEYVLKLRVSVSNLISISII